MNVNFAERAHNHNWKLDPIVRSLLDTDFYKLLMLQFIWKNFPAVHVTSEVVNRTVRVRLAEELDRDALIEQMEFVRGLRFRRSEIIWLAGNTFYGTRHIFESGFLAWLESDFRLSDYDVAESDGQLVMRFSGLWSEVTLWEIYALAIVSELRTRTALARLNEMELDVLYARAKTRLWNKIERLRAFPDLSPGGSRPQPVRPPEPPEQPHLPPARRAPGPHRRHRGPHGRRRRRELGPARHPGQLNERLP